MKIDKRIKGLEDRARWHVKEANKCVVAINKLKKLKYVQST